jgi:hypothetical protein
LAFAPRRRGGFADLIPHLCAKDFLLAQILPPEASASMSNGTPGEFTTKMKPNPQSSTLTCEAYRHQEVSGHIF